MSDETAWCSTCETDKPAKDFYRNSARSNGLQSACKSCQKPPTLSQMRDLERKNKWLERSNKRIAAHAKLLHDTLLEHGIDPPEQR